MQSIERRTFPESRSNHGGVRNNPDVPVVEVERVAKLDIFVPNIDGHSVTPTGLAETNPASFEIGFVTTKVTTRGIRVVPLVRKPLIPVYQTSHGGGRIGGGGTSKEALRRAKRKIKQSGEKHSTPPPEA